MEIIFRADGDSVTGLGHIMRSAALMQMLGDDHACKFLTKNPQYFPYRDFTKTAEVIAFDHSLEHEADELLKLTDASSVIVADGYQFGTSYQEQIKAAGFKLVCIDDIVQEHFVANVVINHAGGLSAADYSAAPYTRFCLGPSYALVKPAFKRVAKDIDRKVLLVSLGGADPANATTGILNDAILRSFSRVHVVLGAANQNAEMIKQTYTGNATVNVHHNITALEMLAIMNDASYAVLSPSTVCYEYMTTTGVVFLYQIAGNQENIKKYFIGEGLAFDFSEIGKVSTEEMHSSVEKQKTVFDGKSAARLRKVFADLKEEVLL